MRPILDHNLLDELKEGLNLGEYFTLEGELRLMAGGSKVPFYSYSGEVRICRHADGHTIECRTGVDYNDYRSKVGVNLDFAGATKVGSDVCIPAVLRGSQMKVGINMSVKKAWERMVDTSEVRQTH